MKDRFWTAYFYVMWFLFLFGLFAYQDSQYWITNQEFFNGYEDDVWTWLVMMSAIPMTIIRYVAIGKHFWNKP